MVDGSNRDGQVAIPTDNKFLTRFLVRPVVVLLMGVVLILIRDARPPLSSFGALFAVAIIPLNMWVVIRLITRMRRPRPAAVLTVQGIFDDGSLIGRGIGLIEWTEIEAITSAYWGRDGFFSFRHDWFVVIVPRDEEALLAQRSVWIRLLRRVLRIVVRTPPGVCIPDFMLADRPTEVLATIEAFLHDKVKRHSADIVIAKPDLERVYRSGRR